MMMEKWQEKKLDDIPAEVKTAPVTLWNYDQKAGWYGYALMKWADKWPFLSRDPERPGTADEGEWDLYFRDHLSGFPKTYALFRNGRIRYLNMPDHKPEAFDASYHPNPRAWLK
jgi:hypothetical protein